MTPTNDELIAYAEGVLSTERSEEISRLATEDKELQAKIWILGTLGEYAFVDFSKLPHEPRQDSDIATQPKFPLRSAPSNIEVVDSIAVRKIVVKERITAANSLTESLMSELKEAVEDAGDRVLLLSADGPAFCSGFDRFDLLRTIIRDGSCQAMLDALLRLYEAIMKRQHPTACIVQGVAAGGGVGLATCFDVVVASPDARFKIPAGSYAPLARVLIPFLNIRQQHFGSRKVSDWIGQNLNADDARLVGLVNAVVDGELPAMEEAAYKALEEPDIAARAVTPIVLERIQNEARNAREMAMKPEIGRAIGIELVVGILASLSKSTTPDGVLEARTAAINTQMEAVRAILADLLLR